MIISDFYLNEYPTDELGAEIDTRANFVGLLDTLHKGGDVYEYIGVGDSLIRERLFNKLSELLGKAYNDVYVYNLWLKQ
jgi:hypothetical protein